MKLAIVGRILRVVVVEDGVRELETVTEDADSEIRQKFASSSFCSVTFRIFPISGRF